MLPTLKEVQEFRKKVQAESGLPDTGDEFMLLVAVYLIMRKLGYTDSACSIIRAVDTLLKTQADGWPDVLQILDGQYIAMIGRPQSYCLSSYEWVDVSFDFSFSISINLTKLKRQLKAQA